MRGFLEGPAELRSPGEHKESGPDLPVRVPSGPA